MNFRMLSSRTQPRVVKQEEEHKDELRSRSFSLLLLANYRFLVTGTLVPGHRARNGATPSPYIGERVAYRGRNPNGIFEQTNYFTKLLYKATLIVGDAGIFFNQGS